MLVLHDAVQQVRLLVIVGGQDDENEDILQDSLALNLVAFDGLGRVDLAIVLADVEVFVLVESVLDHQVVEAQLQILGALTEAAVVQYFVFLDLEEGWVDFAADNQGSDVVLVEQA